MGYTIYTRDQVTPREILVHGATADHYAPNPGPPVVLPPECYTVYVPLGMDKYSPDPLQRRILISDPGGTATGAEIVAAFPELRTDAANTIRREGARRLAALVGPYRPEERETWHVQQREAEALQADPESPAPMVRAMAAARGIPVAILAGKILENVEAFRLASGIILGQQQALLDAIDTCTDFDRLMNPTWPDE
jgi:hypothetical protein